MLKKQSTIRRIKGADQSEDAKPAGQSRSVVITDRRGDYRGDIGRTRGQTDIMLGFRSSIVVVVIIVVVVAVVATATAVAASATSAAVAVVILMTILELVRRRQ
ncbi:hypothetical protein ElyMa_004137800 [Elysia marginata]|uniref:Uncharacterized protein n=1 Tax=Elysia marginata TaxID=1093978 RepID=A0AAV4GFR3_9GAST|nr:hypothetical protein ElyMa_004137800 [Elysia marginata]